MARTFVALYRPGPGWLADTPVWGQPLEEHGRYMHQLFLEGRLQAGGPFTDWSGGLAIFVVEEPDEAQRLIDEDPAVVAGTFAAELHPWMSVDWPSYRPRS
ncbi:MAG: hypothetical protein KC621_09870 [Myxococcales bacterium]|nr:hypothetical protein [Myxococcales bacterium]